MEQWSRSSVGRSHYDHLASYLNEYIRICHAALDKDPNFSIKREGRWNATLNFVVYYRPTKDGVEDASPVKPVLVGGDGLMGTRDEIPSWSPLNENDKAVRIPVECEEGYPELICQAATYAQCLIDASPFRQFALVLGFEHIRKEFRFLIVAVLLLPGHCRWIQTRATSYACLHLSLLGHASKMRAFRSGPTTQNFVFP